MAKLKFICLSIFISSTLQAHAADMKTCIQQVCASLGAPSAKEFMDREKSTHPGLTAFYQTYQSRLENVRLGRQRLVVEVLKNLGDSQAIQGEIDQMNDAQLLIEFFNLDRWNQEIEMVNGEYTVVAEPLFGFSQTEKNEFTQNMFERFKTASLLFSADLKVRVLKQNARKVLSIDKNTDLESYILSKLTDSLFALDAKQKIELESEIHQTLAFSKSLKNKYGENALMIFGEIDLKIQILLGAIPITPQERELVQKIIKDEISGVMVRSDEILSKIQKIFNPQTWKKQCRSSYNKALHYSLTEKEHTRFEKIKTEALERTSATLNEILGPRLAGKTMNHIKTMDVGGPLTLAEYRTWIEGYLKAQEDLLSKRDLSLTERKDLIHDMGAGGEDKILDSLCSQWVFEPVRDGVNDKNVILSSFSAKNPDTGLAIVTHEFAHAASVALHFLSTRGENINSFLQIRQCISENYISSGRTSTVEVRFESDKKWTEEDWADAFSGYARRDLKTNEMCSLVGVINYDFTPLEERPENDNHSPTFYRILNIQTHKGKDFSNQCASSLEKEHPGLKFKNCLGR